METGKFYCKSCQLNRVAEMFEGGFKTCIKCRGKKLARYYRKLEYYQEMRKNMEGK